MEQIITVVLVAAVVLFAITRMAPDDSPLYKAAVTVIAALLAVFGSLWEWIQSLL